MNTNSTNRLQAMTVLTAAVFTTMATVSQAHAFQQKIQIQEGMAEPVVLGIQFGGQWAAPPIQTNSDPYSGGAALKTDPELAAVLEKADEFKKDGNYRVAAKLWQSVLERSGDTLYSDDDETYYSLAGKVETIIAGLPPEGLRAYRISADASATEILAQATSEDDLQPLHRVVKEYFLSSHGDDAAYRLGNIYLDQFDFVGAIRMFRKITDHYPDPSVPISEVWLRLAVAYRYLGDSEACENALARCESDGLVDPAVIQVVRQQMKTATQMGSGSERVGPWAMAFGDPQRRRAMPGLPEDYFRGDLQCEWQFWFEPSLSYDKDNFEGGVREGLKAYDESITDTVTRSEENLIKNWKNLNWRPSGQLIVHDGKVLFKTSADLTAWPQADVDGIRPLSWRSVWLNRFQLDEATRTMKQMHEAYRRSRWQQSAERPVKSDQVQLLGDRVHQSMSLYRGVVYSIEGKEYNHEDGPPPQRLQNHNFQWGVAPRRVRFNALTAYNADDGKLLWRLPPEKISRKAVADEGSDEEEAVFDDIGFMAAPIGVGDHLLVPVNIGGSIWIYALDSANQGELVWRSYLCDEPSGGCDPWSPILMSVEGSSAYVCCGMGVIFALDPMTGIVQFARRYRRTGQIDTTMQQMGVQQNWLILDGYDDDVIIPAGNVLLIFASDQDIVLAIDRQTGEFVWKVENAPFGERFDYLLGVYGDLVFVGGTHTVAAFRISVEGRLEWRHSFDGEKSLGRGMVTPDGVFVPVEDSIVQLSLEGEKGLGKVIHRAGVITGTGAPVGNLYSDGERIWVVGGNRLYALSPVPHDALETTTTSTE